MVITVKDKENRQYRVILSELEVYLMKRILGHFLNTYADSPEEEQINADLMFFGDYGNRKKNNETLLNLYDGFERLLR